MATETVQTTQTKQPGKTEIKEEIKTETKEGVKVETKREVKTETKPEPTDPFSRVGRAEAIIQRNFIWSLGAGAIPLPIVDVAAVLAVQLKMLKELSNLYGLPFSSSIAKKIVYSLLSSVGGVGLGALIGAGLAKAVPTVGTALGVIAVPIFAGAFTHATGRVFLMHFESGGTFLDFNPHTMRAHFRQEFEKAKETAAQAHAAGAHTTATHTTVTTSAPAAAKAT
ncbi:YcjF family protein [Chondromyces apiculatus]|uniref:GTPase domain-containing protein n=1 Tax=Chondromyces apiculatus DSM 436 TaxID=1192034 RepID=A0A017T6I4_9BACT|nr:YcjF family protein [Chondromyces apiculatus]EYF04405.1 Hypothetical protein CAP_4544 [Chondromyces apiculatus DSM 436]